MKVTKERYTKDIEKLGFTLGCYDSDIEKVSAYTYKKIMSYIEEEFMDIEITINRKKHVLEISTTDNEKDIRITTVEEYKNQYGYSNEEYRELMAD